MKLRRYIRAVSILKRIKLSAVTLIPLPIVLVFYNNVMKVSGSCTKIKIVTWLAC